MAMSSARVFMPVIRCADNDVLSADGAVADPNIQPETGEAVAAVVRMGAPDLVLTPPDTRPDRLRFVLVISAGSLGYCDVTGICLTTTGAQET